jgi:ribosome-associated heat shock protein Hsp15
MRIDKLLWFLRFTKTRGIAQTMIGEGHIRLNGRRIERAHQGVEIGDVLVLPLPAGVRVVEVLALPNRRGPATEAQSCYRVLDEVRPNPLAATPIAIVAEGDLQP